MFTPMNSPDPAAIARMRRILPLAFMASGLLLWGLVEGLALAAPEQVGFMAGDSLAPIRYGLMAGAALILMTGLFLHGRAGARGPAPDDPQALARTWPWEIAAYACADGVVVLGFLLFFIGGARMDFYVLALPAGLAMLWFYTRRPAREI